MPKVEIELPEELAQRVRRAGLLSEGAIERLLEDAMRRQAGRALIDVAISIQEAGIQPMSMEELNEEVKEVRAERRARASRIPTTGGPPGHDTGRC